MELDPGFIVRLSTRLLEEQQRGRFGVRLARRLDQCVCVVRIEATLYRGTGVRWAGEGAHQGPC